MLCKKLIIQDRHVKYCEIEATLATLGISSTSLYKILHENLAVKNICSRWIPHNLTKPSFRNDSSEMEKML